MMSCDDSGDHMTSHAGDGEQEGAVYHCASASGCTEGGKGGSIWKVVQPVSC